VLLNFGAHAKASGIGLLESVWKCISMTIKERLQSNIIFHDMLELVWKCISMIKERLGATSSCTIYSTVSDLLVIGAQTQLFLKLACAPTIVPNGARF
jgi:hypothetical protein